MRFWLISGIGLLAGLILTFAIAFTTVGQETRDVCRECGLERLRKTHLGSESIREKSTAWTEWHRRRAGIHPEHHWALASITGLNILHAHASYRWGPAGDDWWITNDTDRLARILRRLEPLDLDVDFHRHLTQGEDRRRGAARSTTWCFDPRWSDESVRAWWEKTRRFLEDESHWNFSYRWGTHPMDRIPRFSTR